MLPIMKCPVCDTDYIEAEVEICRTCGWDLVPYSQGALSVAGQNLEGLKQPEAWARQIWEQMKQASQGQFLLQNNPNVLIEQISKLISPLEQRLEAMEQYLKANYQAKLPYNPATSYDEVMPSIDQNIPKIITLSQPTTTTEIQLSLQEAQLVAAYNHNLNLLSKKTVEVSETEESMSQGGQLVTLESTRRGNYWIITAGEFNYLVPSPKLRINAHNYKTLEKLFDCCGYQPGKSNEILLLKSAKVSVMSIGQKWGLVERGLLYFEPREEGEVENQREIILVPEETPTSQSEFRQVRTSSYQNPQERQVESTLNHKIASDPNQSTPTPENQSRPAPPELYMSPQEAELVIAYNKNADSLLKLKKATEVSETDESINQRRLGIIGQPAVLQASRWGDYWIIAEGSFNYLVPRSSIKFKQNTYETVQVLFECYGGQLGAFHQFKLLKAAQVSSIYPQKWELIERGILLFE
ncbi:hypothetical protein [Microcoleus sp. herbarium19]|uniref:hypothetical protein n=1 Tax=Microcoleus sp. herbarium19 TaxID=3055440 RepID=UPI002FD78063